jgi:hypothetical protein
MVIIRGLHVKEGITAPGNPCDIVPKQSLPDWMDKENMRSFWIYRISLLFKKKPFGGTKLFAVTKFVKQGIRVFVKFT